MPERFMIQQKIKVLLAFFLLMAMILPTTLYFIKHSSSKKLTSIQVIEPKRSLYYLPQYLAISLGFFKEQNLNVSMLTIPGGTGFQPVNESLFAPSNKKPTFVLTDPETFYSSSEERSPEFVAFAGLAQRNGSLLLSRESIPEFKWQELKGKTIIGYPPECTTSILLKSTLKKNGLAPNYNVTVYQNIPEHLKAGVFQSGAGHFLMLTEPEASLVESKNLGRVVASLGKASGEIPSALYLTTPKFLQLNPQVIQKFTNAIYKTQLWMLYHNAEEEASAIQPFFPQVNKKILAKAIKRYHNLGIWAETPVLNCQFFSNLQKMAENVGEPGQYFNYSISTCFAKTAVGTIQYQPEKNNN